MGEDKLSSLSGHSKRSSHGKDEFMSVTVRKEDPKQKAGIRLEAETNGRIRVTNIALNGLFAESEIAIGDIVLSVNGKRLARGEEPDVLVEVIKNATSKVTMVVKKTNVEPRVAENTKKDETKTVNNNVQQRDSYYEGQSKHNEYGSLAFTTSADMKKKKKKKKITSCTITANKEDQELSDDIDETAGLAFVVQKKLLFVNHIAKDSVFQTTELKVGDRVLSINDCNFRAYADANFAGRNVIKANNAVTIVVEKGVEGFTAVPVPDAAASRNKTPTRRRRNSKDATRRSTSKEGKRTSSASRRSSKDEETKPLRRKLKSTSDDTSDIESTDSLSGESFGANDDDDDDEVAQLGLPMSRSNYKEVVITAPKSFSAQDIGVVFECKKQRHIGIKEIEEDSIFANTSLEPGDIVLEINDVDFRKNPDTLHALMTCKKTNETVTMLVWKEDAKFKQQVFNLDSSSTNLEWQ
jgi:C-terminal processing protease CtpA/Prc